jgi:DNA replication and repair protein RecF
VLVERIRLRDFRSYATGELCLSETITVVQGRNGAGKTNLLEALYLGCTGGSFRTASDREMVRFGAPAARVEVDLTGDDGAHTVSVGLAPGQPRRLHADGAAVERLADVPDRPLVAVFLPDRLGLVKGPPALRRAHLDQVVAALWPSRAETRRAYARALAQRNALLGRMRSGSASPSALGAWDAELSEHGIALMADRRAAIEQLADRFCQLCDQLGLDGGPQLAYRPRSRAAEPAELAAELADRLRLDLERGFTGHGPHRDELVISREGRDLRTYGSQGQQRLAVLSLLLSERAAIAAARGAPPLMLLDDVMSELDSTRRGRLVALLAGDGGRSVITATELDQVPGSRGGGMARATVSEGAVLEAAGDRAAA